MALLYALVTVLAWGTWLLPSQRVPFRSAHVRTFYVTTANLLLASSVWVFRGRQPFGSSVFWLPFCGGLLWALSGYCAFTATNLIGMAAASAIWTPLNVVVGLTWGALLYGELRMLTVQKAALLAASIASVLAGISLVLLPRRGQPPVKGSARLSVGLAGALAAGLLWGTYFIPVRQSQASLWTAALPLAMGMFVGSATLTVVSRQALRLPHLREYALALLSGLLWGTGNYGMLLLAESVGTGRGFAIAQLGVVVNASLGILVLKDPRPGTQAATVTLIGVLLAMVGGIGLGSVR